MSDTSDTPLSDLIAAVGSGSSESWAQFLDTFRWAQVGVIGVEAPADTVGKVVSTAARPISLGLTRHAGRPMVLAFADPKAFAARFGWKFNAAMAGQEVLATALFNPECEGVLVNSALAEVSVVIDRATAESLVRPGALRDEGKVAVPEGHKVVVFRPSPRPFLAQAESGVWILNFGDGTDPTQALDAIDEFVEHADQQNVIWILQAAFLYRLQDVAGFLTRVRNVIANSDERVRHCAVFAAEASRRTDVMHAFRQLGLGVHYSAPDGACFVEVHRPDGIVVGMPGRAFGNNAF